MVIDAHAHIVMEEFVEEVRNGKYGAALYIEKGQKWDLLVTKNRVLGQERAFKTPLPRKTYDLDRRLKDMKAAGVDRQILSILPACTYYALDLGLSKKVACAFNDQVADLARKMPDRFSCLCTVPLQDPEAAVRELERAIQLGHIGVEIGSNVAGKNLDDPELDLFWGSVVSLDVPVFIHPVDVLGLEDRLKNYYLFNLIGTPLDTTIAAASLIFGGVMERFPKLKVLLPHLGGFTPWIRGRWEHGYKEHQETKARGAKGSEIYINKFYYDTIIHQADCLEFALKTLDPGHILFATDYPFAMGALGPAREIPGLARLSADQQEKILSGNARKLYRI